MVYAYLHIFLICLFEKKKNNNKMKKGDSKR